MKRNILKTLSIFIFAGLVVYLMDIACLFRFVTGVPCPFCGMSRAFLGLLSLDLKLAIYYHPLFFLFPIFLFYCACYYQEPKNKRYGLITITLALLYLGVYFIRILFFIIP